LNVYGPTKLAGEAAVLAETTNCVIRVSWVFGPERPSFVDSVFDAALAALAARPLAAVADKFSLPVFTTDLT
jgi:dTDP-4-dehydrorhamnose reductase